MTDLGNLEKEPVPKTPEKGAEVVTVADKVRKWGMYLLLWAFLLTIGLSLVSALFSHVPDVDKILKIAANDRELAVALTEKPFDHLKQILQILLPAETALLGSAMGFYYGSQLKN
jgi:hypothetical protein